MEENPSESLTTTAAFWAYEIVSAALFAGIFAPYALFRMIGTPSYRAGLKQRLSLRSAMDAAKILPNSIWIQAVSLGEVKSISPLVRKISAGGARPILLTSTTKTGFHASTQLRGPNTATAYFPFDFSPVVRRVMGHVNPCAIVLFETEIWPNLIRAAGSVGIPVSIVNGRISERSFRYYRLLPRIFGHVLSQISFAGMQSRADADRIIKLGAKPERVKICGNVKFDAAPQPPFEEEVGRMRADLALEHEAPIIVAGSTHEGEEAALLNVYRRILEKLPGVRMVLAPRHPERFNGVEAVIRRAGFKAQRRSSPENHKSSGQNPIILLDTIGELARIYALGSVAFVGGSLVKVGGHNIIEPASMSKPVVFGRFMHHFEDVKEAFLSERAAMCVEGEEQLYRTLLELLEDPAKAKALGEKAKHIVEANRGATDRYFEALSKFF